VGLIGGLFAEEGGLIRGGSGIKDDVPIWGRKDEFIHPQETVRYYGAGIMEALRQKAIPRELLQSFAMKKSYSPAFAFQTGGLVRESNGAGGPGGSPITIVNLLDTREMDKWGASAGFENAVLNFMSSKASTVRKILR
jgi:hypothetical protein